MATHNKLTLTEADQTAFSLAREALRASETELTSRIIDLQNTLATITNEADIAYYNGEIAKNQVKLAESVISRERLWTVQYKN